ARAGELLALVAPAVDAFALVDDPEGATFYVVGQATVPPLQYGEREPEYGRLVGVRGGSLEVSDQLGGRGRGSGGAPVKVRPRTAEIAGQVIVEEAGAPAAQAESPLRGDRSDRCYPKGPIGRRRFLARGARGCGSRGGGSGQSWTSAQRFLRWSV